jgi:phospholipid-transporting ATPase
VLAGRHPPPPALGERLQSKDPPSGRQGCDRARGVVRGSPDPATMSESEPLSEAFDPPPSSAYGEPQLRDHVHHVVFNDPEANRRFDYVNNHIRSAKYTPWNFVPKNLFEQFRRVSNFYFLMIVILMLIPRLSPLSAVTTIVPLAFVMVITATKEAVEDYARHQADKKHNEEEFKIVRDGEVVSVRSQQLRCGDVVKVNNFQFVPADLVLLSSSHKDGSAFLQTANLDGDLNLKGIRACPETAAASSPKKLSKLRGMVAAAPPTADFLNLDATMVLDRDSEDESISVVLDAAQLMQRGAQLRNTDFAFGLVLYAGAQTKIQLNQQAGVVSKVSTFQRSLNILILWIFLFQVLVCLIGTGLSLWFEAAVRSSSWYLGGSEWSLEVFGLRNFFTYFVLLNTMIPMSLWLMLEIVKVIQARFMVWDPRLFGHDENGEEAPMVVNTSNLNEDLGRIQHVFCDKTGTLTENVMEFRCASVGGVNYEISDSATFLADVIEFQGTERSVAEELEDFTLCMALCHTVVPERDADNQLVYQTESPEEVALVEVAAENGYRLVERTQQEIVLERHGEELRYRLLCTFYHSSVRRRMSVVVERPDGRITLFSKGDDTVINERLTLLSADQDVEAQQRATDFRHLSEYRREGLRTLVLAKRELTRTLFESWCDRHDSVVSGNSDVVRQERLFAAYEMLETKFDLLGVTAIEDQLQPEVPETIDFLLRAGIRVWVLTGDNRETAVNIGFSCKLFTPEMDLVVIDDCATSEFCLDQLRSAMATHVLPRRAASAPDVTLANILRRQRLDSVGILDPEHAAAMEDFSLHSNQTRPLGLVISGAALSFALVDHLELLLDIFRSCRAVICSRATPKHKALIIRAVKLAEDRVVLAIGDGANDVSMIQEANVGVALFGKEGTHAARAADYVLWEFRHLAIHGRYSNIRISGMILYSLYKNMAFTLSLLFFSFSTGFTGQSLFDAYVVTAFTILFTSIPPLLYGRSSLTNHP